MKSKITHKGVVECIDNDIVRVRIVQASACGSCKVAGHCSAAETKVKTIDVVTPQAATYHAGDSVLVSVSEQSAHKALLVGFGLPFVVLVVTVFVCVWLTSNETLSALLGLAALVPYYIIVRLCRNRIGSGVTFNVEKLLE